MRAIGYICKSHLIGQEQMNQTEIEFHESRFQTVDSILEKLRPHVEHFVEDLEIAIEDLKPHVDSVAVKIDALPATAFLAFLRGCVHEVILVRSFRELSPRLSEQLELILEARGHSGTSNKTGRRIVVVSLEQSSLIKLDLDVALELQEQWIIEPMRKALEESTSRADENYIKLRDLMLEKLTVEKIAERLGQSKSTIFRWRKQFEERLAQDIPGFKIGD